MLSFNPLERGIGIGGIAGPPLLMASSASFNPLERGIGIGGILTEAPWDHCIRSFNPLERGIGIGGKVQCGEPLSITEVSIRLNAA